MNKYDSIKGVVVATTRSGVMLMLSDGSTATAFGNYRVNDELLVSVAKKFDSNIPRVRVEAVLEYAA